VFNLLTNLNLFLMNGFILEDFSLLSLEYYMTSNNNWRNKNLHEFTTNFVCHSDKSWATTFIKL